MMSELDTFKVLFLPVRNTLHYLILTKIGSAQFVLSRYFHLTILKMILISSLHCFSLILKEIVILNFLSKKMFNPFLTTLRHLIC